MITANRVTCQRCGYENELSRLFCLRCGGRLDLRRVTAKEVAPPRRSSWGPGKLFRLVSVLAALGVLFLILWPVEPRGSRGIRADAAQLANKIKDLDNATDRGKAMSVLVSEAEANAYVADAVERSLRDLPPSSYRLQLREVNLTFTPSRFIVLIAAHWGPLRLTYELKGTLSKDREIEVIGTRWGHLPLFGVGNAWLVRGMTGVFAGMRREAELMSRLGRVELEWGCVRLWTRGGGAS